MLPLFANSFYEFLFDLRVFYPEIKEGISAEILCGEIPVGQFVEEGFNKLRAQVTVVDVVGVFPDVDAQQCPVSRGQGGARCPHVDDVDGTIGFFDEPGPAGAEIADGTGLEGFLEFVKRTPFLVDGGCQCSSGGSAAIGLEAVPEEGVVPDLGSIVVDAASGGFFDDGFEIQTFVFCAFDEVIEIGDVGLVVFGVVVFECFLRHVRCQGIGGKGQGGERVFHGVLLVKLTRKKCRNRIMLKT